MCPGDTPTFLAMSSSTRIKSNAAQKKAKATAIDSRQRELAEQESQIQSQIDALQRTIAEAPTRAAAEAKAHREAYLQSSRGYYLHSVVPDARHGGSKPVRKRPVLRAERSAARLQTLALVVVLGCAVVWMLTHFLP